MISSLPVRLLLLAALLASIGPLAAAERKKHEPTPTPPPAAKVVAVPSTVDLATIKSIKAVADFRMPGFRKADDTNLEGNPFTPIRRAQRQDFTDLIKEIRAGVRGIIVDEIHGGRVKLKGGDIVPGGKYPYKRPIIERMPAPQGGYMMRERSVPGDLVLKEIREGELVFVDEEGTVVNVPLGDGQRRTKEGDILIACGVLVQSSGLVVTTAHNVGAVGDTLTVYTAFGESPGKVISVSNGLALVRLVSPSKGLLYTHVRTETILPKRSARLFYVEVSPRWVRREQTVEFTTDSTESSLWINGIAPSGSVLCDDDGLLIGVVAGWDKDRLRSNIVSVAGIGAIMGHIEGYRGPAAARAVANPEESLALIGAATTRVNDRLY